MTPPTDSRSGSAAATVAIIGGGFCGSALALHLARAESAPSHIIMLDPRPRLGRGVAYSHPCESLLLNVPAAKLTAIPQEPGDFHRWAAACGRSNDPAAFLPRAWFGEYVESRLAHAVAAKRGALSLRHVRDSADSVTSHSYGLSVRTQTGRSFAASHITLALGHGPTRVPAALQSLIGSTRLILDPWNEDSLSRASDNSQRILLVGTGLTMCDTALMLLHLGYQGEIIAVSRRGLLPRVHGPSDPAPLRNWASNLSGSDLRQLLSAIRAQATEHNWRSAIDAIRSYTPRIWSELSRRDRERFLSRLVPYWDAHRHRMPPEVWSAITVLVSSGRLRVLSAHIKAAREQGRHLACQLRSPHDQAIERVNVDRVILCTGCEPNPSQWGMPLIDALIDAGHAQPDSIGLGLRTTHDGLLIGRDGRARPHLSTLGPMRRGDLWESTAVPELAPQAQSLAECITAHLAQSNSPSYQAHV